MPDLRHGAAWALRLDLPPATLAGLSTVLSPDEHARAARFSRPADRARFIAGRAQLRQVLAWFLDSNAAEVRFAASAHGKPILDAPGRTVPLHFNASRSGALAVVALRTGAEIGVDVEASRAMPDADSLSADLLSEDEQAEYSRLDSAERARRILGYWVRKEALAKSLGTGLRECLRRLSLHPWREDEPFRVNVHRGNGSVSQWVAPLSLPDPGYVGAIASSQPLGPIDVHWWNPPAVN